MPMTAAPPTPWSRGLAEPMVDPSAHVHAFSQVMGDVYVGPNVLIAPGTSIRADEGAPFHIGESTNVQDGVVIHGLEQGRVIGDDHRRYSVWIGQNTSITHMALIHGPAYVGGSCFIGFRSTVFNARIGDGCIVMMHALIQDVEVPPGKFVPSGAVITTQQQADRLPDVQPRDIEFASHVVGVNQALRSGYHCAENLACVDQFRNEAGPMDHHSRPISQVRQGGSVGQDGPSRPESQSQFYRLSSLEGVTPLTSTHVDGLSADLSTQVRQLLAQGFQVGTEYADQRRFRANAWHPGTPIQATSEAGVLQALQAGLTEHQGHYVRLIGIDQRAKRRVLEVVIQRPDGSTAVSRNGRGGGTMPTTTSQPPMSAGQTDLDLSATVRQVLAQGLQVGTEHADKRRFRANAWNPCAPIATMSEAGVLQALQACLAEHQGEYVRLIGIDKSAKRRVLETIIQRPDGASTALNGRAAGATTAVPTATAAASQDLSATVRQVLAQGLQVGTEYADKRRFRANAWNPCAPVTSMTEAGVLQALQACLAEHQGDYVRLIGIDKAAKRRVMEVIIQRPDGAKGGSGPVSSTVSSTVNSTVNSTASVDADLSATVRQVLAQGLQVGTEYADKRRFRANAWNPCAPVTSMTEAGVLQALQACLAEHQGDYVRLIGIDKAAKRRVMEVIVQRP